MAAETLVTAPQRFENMAQRLIVSSKFNSQSEVLEAALDALERDECDEEAKEAWLDEALEAEFASGIAERDVLARAGLPPRPSLQRSHSVTHNLPSQTLTNLLNGL